MSISARGYSSFNTLLARTYGADLALIESIGTTAGEHCYLIGRVAAREVA